MILSQPCQAQNERYLPEPIEYIGAEVASINIGYSFDGEPFYRLSSKTGAMLSSKTGVIEDYIHKGSIDFDMWRNAYDLLGVIKPANPVYLDGALF